jgi:hypothetical protein
MVLEESRVKKMSRITRDRAAREQAEQIEIKFPGLLALVEAKSMDAVIYPKKKTPAASDIKNSQRRKA